MTALERIDELEVFVAIANAGSLSAAGRRLRMGVNRVSRKLARLEERLGVVLITRTTRRLKLTRVGGRFLERARLILEEVAAAEREVVHGTEPKGTLRLAIPTMLTQFGLLDELLLVGRRHPDLHIELIVGDTPVDPVTTGCDAVVYVGRPPDSSHKMVRLGSLSPVLAAAESYLATAGKPERPADLKHHACLRFFGTEPQTHWRLVGPTRRARRVRVGRGLSCNDSRLLYDAMMQGVGIGLAVEQSTRNPHLGLTRVLPEYRHVAFEVFALCPAKPSGSVHTQIAIALLQKGIHLAS